MKHPMITVIIPTYNRYDMLVEAVESVLAQTYSHFEIIVVDDGSTDQTPDLFHSAYPRITYIYQVNQGPASARNRGVRSALGDWVAFLDSDDLWKPDKLEHQVNALEHHPHYAIAYTGEEWIRNGKPVVQRNYQAKYSGWIYPHCLERCIVGLSTVMMHRSIWESVGGMDESLPAAEDYDLWLRLAWLHPFLLIDMPLVIKRDGHPGQLSHQWGLDCYRVKSLEKMMSEPLLISPLKNITRYELCRKCEVLIKGFQKHYKNEEAEYYKQLKESHMPAHIHF